MHMKFLHMGTRTMPYRMCDLFRAMELLNHEMDSEAPHILRWTHRENVVKYKFIRFIRPTAQIGCIFLFPFTSIFFVADLVWWSTLNYSFFQFCVLASSCHLTDLKTHIKIRSFSELSWLRRVWAFFLVMERKKWIKEKRTQHFASESPSEELKWAWQLAVMISTISYGCCLSYFIAKKSNGTRIRIHNWQSQSW